jgi:cysteinyl-tRNA synthetase
MTAKIVNLFNTVTRQIEPLKTIEPGKCSVYCCGPTVYDFQHIGNMRTYIFEDVLVRTIKRAGLAVKHVMNITDVGHLVSDADDGEDKMSVAAKREKKSSMEIAAYYTDIFFKDCQKLNIKHPEIVCKATDHIKEMIALIQKLEARGMTYISGGNVYFDVSKFPQYGAMAKLDLENLKAGARVDEDKSKKSPFDFALWFTKSKFENQELQWDSPWGRGYPGWHIECSAMSMKYLGDKFDIHCGGIDHIPVHHTNEIAQSEGATGAPWVNYWMHGEFLLLNKEKMSKSKGGFITLQTIIDQGIDPLAYRFLVTNAHYRSQLNFSDETLGNAARGLQKLKSTVIALKSSGESLIAPKNLSYLNDFEAAAFDDLNMPKAFASLWACTNDSSLKAGEKLWLLNEMDQILGFEMMSWKEEAIEVSAEVRALMTARDDARKAKNWAESDRLRGEIQKHGFLVEDSSAGTRVKKGLIGS